MCFITIFNVRNHAYQDSHINQFKACFNLNARFPSKPHQQNHIQSQHPVQQTFKPPKSPCPLFFDKSACSAQKGLSQSVRDSPTTRKRISPPSRAIKSQRSNSPLLCGPSSGPTLFDSCAHIEYADKFFSDKAYYAHAPGTSFLASSCADKWFEQRALCGFCEFSSASEVGFEMAFI